MRDIIRPAEPAYVEYRDDLRWGAGRPPDERMLTFSPQGVGEVDIYRDTFPFLKIAVIRRYLNEYDKDSIFGNSL